MSNTRLSLVMLQSVMLLSAFVSVHVLLNLTHLPLAFHLRPRHLGTQRLVQPAARSSCSGPSWEVLVSAQARSLVPSADSAMAGRSKLPQLMVATTDVRLDAAAGSWRTWLPGQSVLVWYDSDDVWHERMLIWPGMDGGWCGLTPDGDLYLEWMLPDGSGDVRRIIALPDSRDVPHGIQEGVYRFRQYPTDDRLKALLREGKSIVDLHYGRDLHGLLSQLEVLTPLDGRKPLDVFFGGHFVPRRLGGKQPLQPGPSDSVPLGPAAGGVPLPAPAAAPALGGPSAKGSFDWLMPYLGPYSEAPSGCVWIATETLGGSLAGSEVFVRADGGSFCLGVSTLMVQRGDSWQKCELVKVEDVPGYIQALHQSWKERLQATEASAVPDLGSPWEKKAFEDLQKRLGVSAEPAGEKEEETGNDVRTLEVCYDERGKRFRSWRDVVLDITENVWPDSPNEGPATVVDNLTHMERYGGTPRLWLQLWARARGVEEGDRVHHELSCLVDILETAGTYDQVNLGSLACMEVCCRRLQSIVDALSAEGGKQDWGNARLFTGRKRAEDLVSPALKAWAAKKGKEEVELFRARSSLRDLRSPSAAASDDAAAALAAGTFPPGGKGKGAKSKRKARGLQAPSPEEP